MSTAIGVSRSTSTRLGLVQWEMRGLIESLKDDLADRAHADERYKTLEHVAGELRVMLDGLLDIAAQLGGRR